MNWTEKKENQLKEWKIMCECYNNSHDKLKTYYNKKSNIFLICNIVFSSFAALFSGISALSDYIAFGILGAIFAAFITALSLYESSDNPERKASKHDNVSFGYREIVLKIQLELTLDKKNRSDADEFLKNISLRMLDLETGAESVPIITQSELKKIKKRSYSIKNINTCQDKNNDIESQDKNNDIESQDKNNDIESQDKNNDVNNKLIRGLSNNEHTTFELFFNTYPKMNIDMVQYQKSRLDNNEE